MNAIVGTSESRIASFICVAASTRPPNVSISKIIASASGVWKKLNKKISNFGPGG